MKILPFIFVTVLLTSCAKTKDSDSENFEQNYEGVFYRYARVQDSGIIIESYDTTHPELMVRVKADSIYFIANNWKLHQSFLKNSEHFYKVPNIDNRPYHVFRLKGDSLIVDYRWQSPTGPETEQCLYLGRIK